MSGTYTEAKHHRIPAGQPHGGQFTGGDGSGNSAGAIANKVAGSTPAQARKLGQSLTPQQHAAVDHELSSRASAMGKPGQVSKTHAAFRDGKPSGQPQSGPFSAKTTADRIATSTPTQAKSIASSLSPDQHAAVDRELSRRATQLGRPGQVTKAHAAFRAGR